MKKIVKLIIFLFVLSLMFVGCINNKIDNSITEEEKKETNEVITNESIKENQYGDNLVSLSTNVETMSQYKLPNVGDELYGFVVKSIYDYENRNAKIVLFEHKKTGATLFLISNDDEDKAACFAFNTLTYDDKGIPHIFEHACLGGSEKYPNANLFMEAINKTYNTFMNAVTAQNTTIYPFSSLSDEQLFSLYKFYMDGVFNPDILRDNKNLEREAYRYVLYDKNDNLDIKGVVYSEMLGVESDIKNIAYRNSLNDLFGNSYMGVVTGGKTTDIPNVTQDDLIQFHDKYYHPSNMIICLYGDIDYKKYLEYSDKEYLNNYEKKQIDKITNYQKNNEFSINEYDFPVSIDDNIDGKTIITYNVLCDGMTSYEQALFELVIKELNKSDGSLDRMLLENLPNADYSIQNELYQPEPFFSIVFENVNNEDKYIVKKIVEDAFAEIVNNGINKNIVENIIDKLQIDLEYEKDSHGYAENLIDFGILTFSNNCNDLLGFLKYNKGLNELEYNYNNGNIDKLINKYLATNSNAVMTITTPKQGLSEENNKNKIEKLNQMKLDMTDEELDLLIQNNISYDKWAEEQKNNSICEMLRVASVSELPEYIAKCYADDEIIDGIRFITSSINDTDIDYFKMFFDISGLTKEEIYKLKLATELFFNIPTTNYDYKSLDVEFNNKAYEYGSEIYVNYYYNGGYKPCLSFFATSLDKNYDKVFELTKELMYESIFNDTSIAKSVISTNYNSLKNYASYDPTGIANEYISLQNNKDYKFEFDLNSINYMNFLNDILNKSDDEILLILNDCKNILNKVYNKNGFVCHIIANDNNINKIKNDIIELSKQFNTESINIKEATYSEINNKIAIVNSGVVNYNYISMPLKNKNIEYTSKYAIASSIVDDKILYPEFRVKNSAYGSYSSVNRDYVYIYTYRDPYLKQTYDIYNDLDEKIDDITITDRELEDYKLNNYSNFSYPLTKFQSANIAIEEVFNECDEKRPERYLRYMKEIKNTKKEDLYDMFDFFKKINDNNQYITVGSREQIEKNKQLFDQIIYDYVE